MLDEYDRLVDEFGLSVVNAGGSITEQQRDVPQAGVAAPARSRTDDGRSSTSSPEPTEARRRERSPGSYYGHGIPYLPIDGYPGKIIAIEGTDGVGRSTQIALLREWLEVQGYGVIETGWTRSELMQPTIDLAKASNTLNKLTFVLLYATDFADRLEKEIIPALKAGFIVLSDRYIFTAMARAGVRGVDRPGSASCTASRIAPHLVFYLKIDEKTLIRRVLQSRGMDYWESGHGPQARRRHLRELPRLPARAAARVRVDGRRVRLPRARRAPQGRRHPGRVAPPDRRVPGRKTSQRRRRPADRSPSESSCRRRLHGIYSR